MKCVYCCNETKEEEFARAHVPPKSFFKKGTSSQITIPACRACNNKKSSDDELVLNILSMSNLISINPQHQFHIDKMLRAVKRPQKEGFIKALLIQR
ncbi:HNH endonuclease [Vibrio rotiferianus]|uniref:HNH endonuclease n=1 Tax=Vibrio rotiferianus TaxID=190895 RepID=UPI00339B1568